MHALLCAALLHIREQQLCRGNYAKFVNSSVQSCCSLSCCCASTSRTGEHRTQAWSCLLQALIVFLLHAGPDQLFVRVHDAVRYCEEMCNSSSGIMNGFHYNEDGHEAPLSSAAEPLLPRRSIDCV